MRVVGPVLMLVGVALVGLGALNCHTLLALPLEGQQAYLARAIFPLVGGLWLVIGGVRLLVRARG